jgi:hypothetical protein
MPRISELPVDLADANLAPGDVIPIVRAGFTRQVEYRPEVSDLPATATGRLLGRHSANAGPVQEIVIGAGLVLTAGTLSSPDASPTMPIDAAALSATRNAVSGDINKRLVYSGASAITLTWTSAPAVGSAGIVIQNGAGRITLAGSGVTVVPSASATDCTSIGINSALYWECVATGKIVVHGGNAAGRKLLPVPPFLPSGSGYWGPLNSANTAAGVAGALTGFAHPIDLPAGTYTGAQAGIFAAFTGGTIRVAFALYTYSEETMLPGTLVGQLGSFSGGGGSTGAKATSGASVVVPIADTYVICGVFDDGGGTGGTWYRTGAAAPSYVGKIRQTQNSSLDIDGAGLGGWSAGTLTWTGSFPSSGLTWTPTAFVPIMALIY